MQKKKQHDDTSTNNEAYGEKNKKGDAAKTSFATPPSRRDFSQDIELDLQVRQLSVLGIIGGACSGCEPSRNGWV